jgi:hypothetical protein
MTEIERSSWGYRNGYAIRFAPSDHPLTGGLLVGENGGDDAGARPANNAPDALHLARQNWDGGSCPVGGQPGDSVLLPRRKKVPRLAFVIRMLPLEPIIASAQRLGAPLG